MPGVTPSKVFEKLAGEKVKPDVGMNTDEQEGATRGEKPLEEPQIVKGKKLKFRKMKFNKVHPIVSPEMTEKVEVLKEPETWEEFNHHMDARFTKMNFCKIHPMVEKVEMGNIEEKENKDVLGAQSIPSQNTEPVEAEAKPVKIEKISKKKARKLEKIANQAELEERAWRFINQHCVPRNVDESGDKVQEKEIVKMAEVVEEPKVQMDLPVATTSKIAEEIADGCDHASAVETVEEPKKKTKGVLRRAKKITLKIFIMKTTYM